MTAPFFRETIFQFESESRESGFEQKLIVADGKNAPHELEIFPSLREDYSTYFNLIASNGEHLLIDCRHEMESCTGSDDISVWSLSYSIDLATFDVKFDFSIPQVDSFKFATHVNFGEKRWISTLYSKDTEVF